MKRATAVAILAVLPFILSPSGTTFSQEPTEPLAGKVIALDAGHGGDELGATYPANWGTGADVYEKDVNLAVVYELKGKLQDAGADVVLTRVADETIYSRRERVDIAIEECKALWERKCDALVSIHHNGSTDPSYDGLLVIYNERRDLPLANAVHDALWTGLSHPSSYVDEGLEHGGYGMTVYGKLASVITEAYYITNTWEAEQYSAGTPTSICDAGGDCREVLVGGRTTEEAAALYDGLLAYFGSTGEDGGKGCPPGKQKQGKCPP